MVHSTAKKRHSEEKGLRRRATKRVDTEVFGIWGMIELENHLFNKYF